MARRAYAAEQREDRDLQASIVAIHRQYFSYNTVQHTEVIVLSVPDTLGQGWDAANVTFHLYDAGGGSAQDNSLTGSVDDRGNNVLELTTIFNATGAATSVPGKRRIELYQQIDGTNYRLVTIGTPSPDGSHLVIRPPEEESVF